MQNADFFARGEWNFYCDLCGAKQKSSQGVKTWDGFWVCRLHKEARNPQDFVRGVKDNQTVPWSVGTTDTYVPGGTAIRDTYNNAILDTVGTAIRDI